MTSFGRDTGELFKAQHHYIHYSKRGGQPQLMRESRPRWVYLHMWGLVGVSRRLNLVWLNLERQNNRMPGSVNNSVSVRMKRSKTQEALGGSSQDVSNSCGAEFEIYGNNRFLGRCARWTAAWVAFERSPLWYQMRERGERDRPTDNPRVHVDICASAQKPAPCF